MKNEDGALKNDRPEIDGESDRVESRRRLLKAGLIAVPFLVTLHALPARAQAQGSLGTYGYGGNDGGGTAGGGGNQSPRGGGRKKVSADDN